MQSTMRLAARRSARQVTPAVQKQVREWNATYDSYTRTGPGPRQYGQGAPFFMGYWHHGVHRSVLERSGWFFFFLLPLITFGIFYDLGYRRVDTEMGPFISDVGRYDGTEYDETEKAVRYRWATDGTLAQYPFEHAERLARYGRCLGLLFSYIFFLYCMLFAPPGSGCRSHFPPIFCPCPLPPPPPF